MVLQMLVRQRSPGVLASFRLWLRPLWTLISRLVLLQNSVFSAALILSQCYIILAAGTLRFILRDAEELTLASFHDEALSMIPSLTMFVGWRVRSALLWGSLKVGPLRQRGTSHSLLQAVDRAAYSQTMMVLLLLCTLSNPAADIRVH